MVVVDVFMQPSDFLLPCAHAIALDRPYERVAEPVAVSSMASVKVGRCVAFVPNRLQLIRAAMSREDVPGQAKEFRPLVEGHTQGRRGSLGVMCATTSRRLLRTWFRNPRWKKDQRDSFEEPWCICGSGPKKDHEGKGRVLRLFQSETVPGELVCCLDGHALWKMQQPRTTQNADDKLRELLMQLAWFLGGLYSPYWHAPERRPKRTDPPG